MANIWNALAPWGDDKHFITILFVWIIIVVALSTLAVLVRYFVSARTQVITLEKLTEGLDESNVANRRYDLREKSKGEGIAAFLWREYDETLVTDGRAVRNTVPAEEHFSIERVAGKLVTSRLLATVPALLTALGLLGTFIGLAVGLSGLNLSPEADVEELRQGIESMVAGAALGFTASVWGVGLSVLVNVSEKITIGRISARLSRFTTTIDEFFVQHSPEQALVTIESNTKSTSLALEELHEKIGTEFQKSIQGLSAEMGERLVSAIEGSMKQPLAALADRTSQQSAQLFEELIGRFSEGFQSLGTAQAESMVAAAQSVQGALDSLTAGVASTMTAVQDAIGEQTRTHAQYTADLAKELDRLANIATTLRSSVESLATQLKGSALHVENAATALDSSSSAFGAAAIDLVSTTGGLRETLISVTDSSLRIAQSQEALDATVQTQGERLTSLNETVRQSAESLTQAAAWAESGFSGLTQKQDEFLDSLGKRVGQLSKELAEWLNDYTEQVTHQTNHRMEQWNVHTREFASHMLEVSTGMAEVIDDVKSALEPRGA